jgi:hypothetical protein
MAKKQQPKTKSKSKSVSKKVIAKKSAPKVERIKDEKKVKAGKVRQATGIKDSSGRFVSKIFTNEIKKTLLATKKVDVSKIKSDQSETIDKLLKDAKVTPKQIKSFYEKNKQIFEDLNTFGNLKGTSKNSNQIEKAIDKYKGKILINDGTGFKEVTKTEAKFQFANFKQLLSSNINVVEFYVKPTLSINGTMKINLPEPKEFRKKIKKYFEITNLKDLDNFTAEEISEAIKEILEEMFDEPDIVVIIS